MSDRACVQPHIRMKGRIELHKIPTAMTRTRVCCAAPLPGGGQPELAGPSACGMHHCVVTAAVVHKILFIIIALMQNRGSRFLIHIHMPRFRSFDAEEQKAHRIVGSSSSSNSLPSWKLGCVDNITSHAWKTFLVAANSFPRHASLHESTILLSSVKRRDLARAWSSRCAVPLVCLGVHLEVGRRGASGASVAARPRERLDKAVVRRKFAVAAGNPLGLRKRRGKLTSTKRQLARLAEGVTSDGTGLALPLFTRGAGFFPNPTPPTLNPGRVS